jgi:hypothetical protein
MTLLIASTYYLQLTTNPPGFKIRQFFGYTERRSDFVCGPLNNVTYIVREPPFMPTSKSGITIPENAIRLKGVNSKDTGINIQVSNGGKYCTEGFIWQVSTWIDNRL